MADFIFDFTEPLYHVKLMFYYRFQPEIHSHAPTTTNYAQNPLKTETAACHPGTPLFAL
jgi:hypothetical protein